MRYFAFGETRYELGTTPTSRRYTSQIDYQDIGLYDYGARFYDPAIGRFISSDSIVPKPDDPPSFNRYSYSRNSPIRYLDPNGHFWQEALKVLGKALAGAVLGAAVGVASEATVQLIVASTQGKSINTVVQEFSQPQHEAKLIGAGIGGAVTGALLGATDGKGGIATFAAGGIMGGQAEALSRGVAEEQLINGTKSDISQGVEQACQYGFLDPLTAARDGLLAVGAGVLTNLAYSAVTPTPKVIPQIDFQPNGRLPTLRIIGREMPATLSYVQKIAVIATKRITDWIIGTSGRYISQ